MRGLPNVSFILFDEAGFFPPGQQQDARDVSERYIAKSDPYIVMVSTPNAPDGLFERIEKESEDTVDTTYIDGANPSFIKSLKLQIGKDPDYDKVIARYRSEGLDDSWSENIKIILVNFKSEHKAMLGHCKMILERDGWRE